MTVFNISLDLTETDVDTIEYLALNKPEDPDYGALFVALWAEIEPDVPYFPVLGDYVQIDEGTIGTWINLGAGDPLIRVESIQDTEGTVMTVDGAGLLQQWDSTADAFRVEQRVTWGSPDYNGLGDTYHEVYPLTIDALYYPEETADDGSGWYLAGDEG